jgi:hypothetical protein
LLCILVRLNFQECSGPGVLCIFTLKCASRHNAVHFSTFKFALRPNGVQFLVSHLAKWLRTRRSREAHWKKTVFRDFSTFPRTLILFLLTLSLL